MLLIRVVPLAMVRFDKNFQEDLLNLHRDRSHTLTRESNRRSGYFEEYFGTDRGQVWDNRFTVFCLAPDGKGLRRIQAYEKMHTASSYLPVLVLAF